MIDPEPLAAHYTRFRVTERVLLTGHSHQAWPDVGFAGQQEAWTDAAEHVDDKWERAFAMADRVRAGYRAILADPDGHYALGGSTHDLVVRFLSALPLDERPRIVTTDGEYHSLRRQLARLGEAGIDIVPVPVEPVATLAARVADAVTAHTAAVCMSAVLFRDARIVTDVAQVAQAARHHGTRLLVDAYHALNAVPFTIDQHDLADAYLVGGGYKYCQLGEGNCFLRVPPDTDDRPVITGWYSEFSAIAATPGARVAYGRGHDRFAGSTYDPTSQYRAARVLDFFVTHELTPNALRATSQRQVARLVQRFSAADVHPAVAHLPRVPPDGIAGFLAVRCGDAAGLHQALKTRGVHTDYRGDLLRLGPAPYVTDAQLDAAIDALLDATRQVR